MGSPDMVQKSLGLKFGGKISVTSSELSPRRSTDRPGVSITKMKGDTLVGPSVGVRDHRMQQQQHLRAGPSHQATSSQQVEVKQEPVDADEQYEDEDFDEYSHYDQYAPDSGEVDSSMYAGSDPVGGFEPDSYEGADDEEEEEED
jgi:hypothetical protein